MEERTTMPNCESDLRYAYGGSRINDSDLTTYYYGWEGFEQYVEAYVDFEGTCTIIRDLRILGVGKCQDHLGDMIQENWDVVHPDFGY